MIQREAIDRLIVELQELAASYGEVTAFAASHSKAKAEHATVNKELQQFKRELSDLQLQYQAKRQELGQLTVEVAHRTAELNRVNSEIQNARQRAFGG